MSERALAVIAGALSGKPRPKAAQLQDAIAKRWRMDGSTGPAPAREPAEERDVISLMDGWIRRLERESGSDQAQTR